MPVDYGRARMGRLPFEVDLGAVPAENRDFLSREGDPLANGNLGACVGIKYDCQQQGWAYTWSAGYFIWSS